MREIKFRAWLKEDKKMVDVSLMSFSEEWIGFHIYYEEEKKEKIEFSDFDGDEIELMQYTNLKDKNGKEIYEGDIVILNDAEEENKCIVKYKYGSYILVDGDLREDLSNVEDKFLEVVGNIYENKDLLEENN